MMDCVLSPEVQECLDEARQGYDVLHFNYQGLHELPPQLFEGDTFKHISKMHAKRNRLQCLPNSIGSITNLTELYLHSNNIAYLPESIGQLCNLQSLDLSYNELTTLPETICDLHDLEILAIPNNKMKQLPKELSRMKSLRVLDLINNQLSSLPKEIAKCNKLQRLLVDRNKLTWLPRQLCDMKKLEEISAAGNTLLCLPLDIGHVPTLKTVYVDNNKTLHAIPLSVQSQEIGFNSCGSMNHSSPSYHGNNISNISTINIKHNDDVIKVIHLPPEITKMATKDNCVVPLLELATRELHKYGILRGLSKDDLPQNLHDLLQGPTASCSACQRPIFTTAFPMVFEGQIRVYSLYYLGLCCSQNCVRLATLLIQLPVVYPDSTAMSMAIALVE